MNRIHLTLTQKMSHSSNEKVIWDKVIGKIKFVGNDDFHLYEWIESGVRQASVTTKMILEKPFLYDYSAKKAFEYLEAEGFSSINLSNREIHLANAIDARRVVLRDSANNVGTPSHNVIEEYIRLWIKNGVLPNDITTYIKRQYVLDETLNRERDITDPRIYASVRSAEKWFRKMEHKIRPLFAEIIVGDERYSAGRIDFVFEFISDNSVHIMDWKTSNDVYDDNALQASAYANFLTHMTGLTVGAYVAHLSKERDEYKIYKVGDIRNTYSAFKSLCKVYDWKHNGRIKLIKDRTIYDTTRKKYTKSLRSC